MMISHLSEPLRYKQKKMPRTREVWALELSDAEAASHFPSGTFRGNWGAPVRVTGGDVLVTPFPGGGEVGRVGSELVG